MLPFKGTWWQNQSIRKSNFLVIVWSQCVLQCFNFYMKKCSKLNTYLDTIFPSEWGYCVYIEIPLKLSPAPTLGALKKWAQWCYIFLCTLVNKEWHDQLILLIQHCNIHALICKLNIFNLLPALVFHLYVFLPCDLTSWILMTVTRDNHQLTVVRMESKSFWYDSRNISFVLR